MIQLITMQYFCFEKKQTFSSFIYIQNLKINKYPSLDGFSSKFNQTVWNQLQCMFMKMIKE